MTSTKPLYVNEIDNWRGYGRCIKYKTIGSTNEEAKLLAKLGATDWTIIQSDKQTKGRGRHGNVWDSAVGNLYMSVILHVDVKPADIGQLSFVAAISIARAMNLFLPEGLDVDLKWPNDIFLHGEKLAGILIETETNTTEGEISWVVLGVGLNVISAPDKAISLADAGGSAVTAEDVMANICHCLKQDIEQWKNEGFSWVREKWLSYAFGLGENIKVRLHNKELKGIFHDLDKDGALILKTENDETQRITSGEIFLESIEDRANSD